MIWRKNSLELINVNVYVNTPKLIDEWLGQDFHFIDFAWWNKTLQGQLINPFSQ